MSSPDIIYTQEFRVANGTRYLQYTERKEAINPNPEDIEISNKNFQQDPDLSENFEGYLGYTDRKAATKMEDDLDEKLKGDYPTFSQGVYELSEEQHQQLISNLKEAQTNKAMLWAGVISFSPEFLTKAGLYDPKTKKVNQKLIKKAIQNAMPTFLANEGLDNQETFWWGDIHLNTNHVHVHLAISQRHNTRPLKNGVPKGMFKNKSIRLFKSQIHHELENKKSRSRMIEIEKALDATKKKLTNGLTNDVTIQQKNYLQQIANALPDYKDKRKWRSSNHSVDFKEAKQLTDQLVNSLLQTSLNNEYSEYINLLKAKDAINRKKYGQKIKDTVNPADKKLREYLANRIYDLLRDNEEQYQKNNSSNKKRDLMAQIKSQGLTENKKLLNLEKERLKKLDPKSKEAKRLKMQIGLRKYYIRQINLDAQKESLDMRIAQLQGAPSTDLNQFFLHSLDEQRELIQLRKLPRYRLIQNPKLMQRFNVLKARYMDVNKVPINLVTTKSVLARKKQLAAEIAMIQSNTDDPSISLVIPNPNSDYRIMNATAYYKNLEDILDAKLQIHKNNQAYQNDLARRNELNRPLFADLKKKYEFAQNSELIDSELEHQLTYINNNQKKYQKNSKHQGIINNNLSRLLGQINQDGRKRVLALRKHLTDEDDIEREDRELEREEIYER